MPPKKKPFNVKTFFEEKLNGNLKKDPSIMDDYDCIYQFEVGDGVWNLDLTEDSEDREIRRGKHKSPDCTIKMTDENFEKMLRRQLNIPMALITGKIKIHGNKALALKLTELFK